MEGQRSIPGGSRNPSLHHTNSGYHVGKTAGAWCWPLKYEGESVNRPQMDIKRKTCDIRTWKKHLFLDISSTNIDTVVLLLYQCVESPQHRSLLTVVSAISPPPFQPLRHQLNACHPVLNRFTRKKISTVYRKHLFTNILSTESFCPQKKHNKTLFFGITLLKHSRSFDYWNLHLNMRMRVCYLDCHEAGLCCYLVIHIENLLQQLQLFYLHLWLMYWLSLVHLVPRLKIRWAILLHSHTLS
jgi:hypothetical protein